MKSKKKGVQPSKEQFDTWLNILFSQAPLGREVEHCVESAEAFEQLTRCFVREAFSSDPKLVLRILKALQIDQVALTSMLKRFQRDAFGVARFAAITQQYVQQGKLDAATNKVIVEEACKLGLRITATVPRKTRVPAAFSLWMCVLRPVRVDAEHLEDLPPELLECFCAAVNFFLTCSYLSKFGQVELGQDPEEQKVRATRIAHDFTFRDVNFSSLEFFYSSIFRLDPRFSEHAR